MLLKNTNCRNVNRSLPTRGLGATATTKQVDCFSFLPYRLHRNKNHTAVKTNHPTTQCRGNQKPAMPMPAAKTNAVAPITNFADAVVPKINFANAMAPKINFADTAAPKINFADAATPKTSLAMLRHQKPALPMLRHQKQPC